MKAPQSADEDWIAAEDPTVVRYKDRWHVFTSAIRRIAEKALKRDTGARGLRAIVEEIMLDIMCELPDQPRGSNYVVTEEVVNGSAKLFPVPEAKIRRFFREFRG